MFVCLLICRQPIKLTKLEILGGRKDGRQAWQNMHTDAVRDPTQGSHLPYRITLCKRFTSIFVRYIKLAWLKSNFWMIRKDPEARNMNGI